MPKYNLTIEVKAVFDLVIDAETEAAAMRTVESYDEIWLLDKARSEEGEVEFEVLNIEEEVASAP